MPLNTWECSWVELEILHYFLKVLCVFLASVCFLYLFLMQWGTHYILFQRKLRGLFKIIFEHQYLRCIQIIKQIKIQVFIIFSFNFSCRFNTDTFFFNIRTYCTLHVFPKQTSTFLCLSVSSTSSQSLLFQTVLFVDNQCKSGDMIIAYFNCAWTNVLT